VDASSVYVSRRVTPAGRQAFLVAANGGATLVAARRRSLLGQAKEQGAHAAGDLGRVRAVMADLGQRENVRAVSFSKFSERTSRDPSMRGRISARASAAAM
jgi:hypothetical protein